MRPLFYPILALVLSLSCVFPVAAQKPPAAGVVLLHGTGGSSMSMAPLEYELREKAYAVDSLEMPWSAMRSHDVPVATAEKKVADALQAMRAKGVRKVFLAGFSKGGLFAAYVAARTPVDGLIAIAPNGGSNTSRYLSTLEQARALIAQGKGDERIMLEQYSPIAGRSYPTLTVPSAYVTWFDPEGAMNGPKIYRELPAGLPILLVVPTRDLENLLQAKDAIFSALPPHPLHRLYEPDSNHIGAVNASAVQAARWVQRVLAAGHQQAR